MLFIELSKLGDKLIRGTRAIMSYNAVVEIFILKIGGFTCNNVLSL